MTDQHPKMILDSKYKHPLTYEIAYEIYPYDKDGHQYYSGDWHQHMQAGANWQLEQCLAWLQANLMENDFQKGYTYLYDPELEFKFEVDKVVENLRAAMRPQQQEKTDNTVQDTELIQRAIRYWEDN